MRILIAEDDRFTRQILVSELTEWGHEVIACADGAQAWEELRAKDAPQLAVLDWVMPGMSGVDICKEIRKLKYRPYTYVILLTGRDDEEAVVEGLASGADDYIIKPFNPDDLRLRIGAGQRIIELQSDLIAAKANLEAVNEELHAEIRERERDKKALKESEERYRIVVEQTGQIVYDYNVVSGEINWSGAIDAITGCTPEEFQDVDISGWAERIHPEDRHLALVSLEEALSQSCRYNAEYRFRRKDGAYRLLEDTGISFTDDSGASWRMLGVMKDITDRRLAEEDLRSAMAKLKDTQEVISNSPAVLLIWRNDQGWPIEFVSDNVSQIGYDASDLLSGRVSISDIVHPDDLGRIEAELEAYASKGVDEFPQEYRIRTRSGSERWMDHRAFACRDSQGNITHYQVIALDITQRKVAEEALKFERAQLLSIFDSINEMVYVADPDTYELLFVNKFGKNLLGKDPAGSVCYKELRGFETPCDFCTNEIILKDKTKPYLWEYHHPEANKDYLMTDSIIRWPDGRDVRFEFATDITARKRAERLAEQAERLRAVGDLASGVAHNFNNLLQVVMGGAQLVLMNIESGKPETSKETLNEILESCKVASETIKRLQSFAGIRVTAAKIEQKVFDLADVAREAVEMTKPIWKHDPGQMGKDIFLRAVLDKGCLVKGSKDEVFEVVVNLIKNAVEALPSGGEIEVAAYVKDNNAVLHVRDTGKGIPKEDVERLFTPFFTTKTNVGAGFGLPTSRVIVDRHGGRITVESSEGVGSTFVVELPLSKETAKTPEPPAHAPVDTKGLSILVIDDLKPLVSMLEQGLTHYGHKALIALSGEEGIELFKANPVDLVVCDLGMPGMNGWQVGAKIKVICAAKGIPKTPFIILTGWGDQGQASERIRESGVDAVVQKPVQILDLLETGRRLVRARQEGPAGHKRFFAQPS